MSKAKEKNTSRVLTYVGMAMAVALALCLYSNISLKSKLLHHSLSPNKNNGVVNNMFTEEALSTPFTSSGAKCLTFEETFDDLIASSNQIYVMTPAKGAGTSMLQFTEQCVGSFIPGKGNGGPTNINNLPMNAPEPWLEKSFTGIYELPKLITSHATKEETMLRLMENIPHSSLIIYMHRDETDRLVSAMKMVVMSRICGDKFKKEIEVQKDGNRCVFREKDLIDMVIKRKPYEMNMGETKLLSCDFYNSIEENRPQMVFVHYKQADKLQKLLASYHCPDLLDGEGIHENVAVEKPVEAFLTLENGGKEVPFLDWLENKRDMFEYTFALRAKQTCRGKSRNMQEDLFTCEDEVLQVTRDTSF